MSNLQSFSIAPLTGEKDIILGLDGKVVLLVNVASQCGLTPHYAGLQKLGCFFTRNISPAGLSGLTKCHWDDWKSSEENDGAVTLSSCKAGARPGWSSKWGKTGELWVTAQNHEDLTCRNGDYGGACSWYGLAE